MKRMNTAKCWATAAAVVALLTGAETSAADTTAVKVRAGDHEDYTRLAATGAAAAPDIVAEPCALIIKVSEPVEWPVERLNAFWSKRLSNYRVGSDGRTLTVDRPCGSTARVRREGRMSFVDVGDAPLVREASAPPVVPPASGEPRRLKMEFLSFSLTPPTADAPVPVAATVRERPPAPVSKARAPNPPTEPVVQAPVPAYEPPTVARGEELKQPLRPLEIAPPPAPPRPAEEKATAEAAPPPPAPASVAIPVPPTPRPPPPPELPPPPLIAVSGDALAAAVHDDFERAARALNAPLSSPSIPPSTQPQKVTPPPLPPFDLSAWGAGNHVERRAELDRRVSESSGEARVDALLDIARYALAHALREEGRGALDAATSLSPGMDRAWWIRVLEDAFRALDRSADPDACVFVAERPNSTPDHAVWRAVALAPTRWSAARTGLGEVTRRLAGYPAELRTRLLTILADGAAHSDADSLNALLAGMTTLDAPDNADGRIDYFRGRLAELRRDPDTALNRYRDASGRRGVYAQRARVRFIELMLSADRMREAEAIERLEALRFAWRGDDVEADALADLGLLHARSGRLTEALDIFGQLGGRFGPTDRGRDAVAAGRALLTTVLDGAANAPTIALAIRARHDRAVSLLDDERGRPHRRIAEALLKGGFSVEAIRVLSELAQTRRGEANAEIGLELARALLSSGRPEEVAAVLDRTGAGDTDPDRASERATLRAEAASENGDHLEAARSLRGLDTPRAAPALARVLIRAGEWELAASAFKSAVDNGIDISPDDAGLATLAADRRGDGSEMADKLRDKTRGTRWEGLAKALAAPPPPAAGKWSKSTATVQLASADALIDLAGRWGAGPDR